MMDLYVIWLYNYSSLYYNPNATAFDGSCYYCYMDDCNTYQLICMTVKKLFDEDGDGVCDSEEVIGCLDLKHATIT